MSRPQRSGGVREINYTTHQTGTLKCCRRWQLMITLGAPSSQPSPWWPLSAPVEDLGPMNEGTGCSECSSMQFPAPWSKFRISEQPSLANASLAATQNQTPLARSTNISASACSSRVWRMRRGSRLSCPHRAMNRRRRLHSAIAFTRRRTGRH